MIVSNLAAHKAKFMIWFTKIDAPPAIIAGTRPEIKRPGI
jgi:hypothetical protein